MRNLFVGAVLSVCVAGSADAALFDFNGLTAGTASSSLPITLGGITVTVTATGGAGTVGVLDTDSDAGAANDPDLRSPFDDVDGNLPSTSFGNALIVQEGGNAGPDDNAGGGTLTFTFSTPVTIGFVDLLDIEERSSITLSGAGTPVTQIGSVDNSGYTNFSGGGDGPNQFKRFTFDQSGVSTMTVIFGGSGAVGQFAAAIPVPAALPLLALGLGGLGYAARRQKRRAA